MPVNTRPGWGNIQTVIPIVTLTTDGGGNRIWTVMPDVGVGATIPVTQRRTRLDYIHARIIFNSPSGDPVANPDWTVYRLIVIKGNLPNSVLQLQQVPLPNTQDLPGQQPGGLEILDDWSYQNALYAPQGAKIPPGAADTSVSTNFISDRGSRFDGLRMEVHHTFGGFGPYVDPVDQLIVLLIPMIRDQLNGTPPTTLVDGVYSAYFELSVWGHEEHAGSDAPQFRSMPRYDVTA